jgi:Leucine-rich repeat (LRR) protein
MKKIHYITIGLLFINLIARGQAGNSVEVFHGRAELMESQKILDLSYQNLEKVPTRALNPEIETLILDNNHIKELPSWIGDLKNLKVLSIRNNSLVELSYVIKNCENLEQLYLSGNKNLSDISNISSSQKLEIIDVVDTQINTLPPWLQMMDNLFYFKFTRKE